MEKMDWGTDDIIIDVSGGCVCTCACAEPHSVIGEDLELLKKKIPIGAVVIAATISAAVYY